MSEKIISVDSCMGCPFMGGEVDIENRCAATDKIVDDEQFYNGIIPDDCPLEDALTAENEALKAKTAGLEADNARMREALQGIANADTSRDVYEYAATTPRMLSNCIEIAEHALKGGE